MMTVPKHANTSRAVTPRGSSRWPALIAIVLFGLLAAACSSGPGSQEEFVEMLVRDGTISEDQATCIAGAVFDEYENQGDALGLISSAESFEFLEGENGVPGFSTFLEQTVQGCVAFGPTSS